MSEGESKRGQTTPVGRCANCGTRHTHAGDGCVCYLCGEFLVAWETLLAAGDYVIPKVQPASIELINELYARAEEP